MYSILEKKEYCSFKVLKLYNRYKILLLVLILGLLHTKHACDENKVDSFQ